MWGSWPSGFDSRNHPPPPYEYPQSRSHYNNHQLQSARNMSSYQNAQQSYSNQRGMVRTFRLLPHAKSNICLSSVCRAIKNAAWFCHLRADLARTLMSFVVFHCYHDVFVQVSLRWVQLLMSDCFNNFVFCRITHRREEGVEETIEVDGDGHRERPILVLQILMCTYLA